MKIMSFNTQSCTNYITQETDYEIMADAIRKLIFDKDMSDKFSKNAVSIREKASLEHVIDLWEEYLSSVVN